VLRGSVGEKCCLENCCEGVLWRSVVVEWCEEMLWSVVEKSCRESVVKRFCGGVLF